MSGADAEHVTLRTLQGEPDEMADLQRVIEAAPDNAQLVTGVPPGLADAQSTYTILPEGKSYDDKFVFGIYVRQRMVGCVDLIRGYPNPDIAFLGLLLIAEPFQRKGLGRAAYRELEATISTWGTCNRIRLSVVRANEKVIPFWRRMGFSPTGETKAYRYGTVVSEHIFFEKQFDNAA